MTDILGAVNDFVLAYCHKGQDLPPLDQRQVVRGWQNVVSALPPDSQEYAVLTLLGTIRHGTNIHAYSDAATPDDLNLRVQRLAGHLVQVDFCSAYPQQTEEFSRMRAEILETLTRDWIAVNFFRKFGISSCYAEDIKPAPFLNEAEQWAARYIVTLHLIGHSTIDLVQPAFSELDIYLENVDVHHPVTNNL